MVLLLLIHTSSAAVIKGNSKHFLNSPSSSPHLLMSVCMWRYNLALKKTFPLSRLLNNSHSSYDMENYMKYMNKEMRWYRAVYNL